MIITPHFIREEFDCRDGTPYPDEWIEPRLKPLCEALEIIRAASGAPLFNLSGYRTKEHNLRVGGKPDSMHLYGRAVDIMSKKLPAAKLGSLVEFLINEGKIPDGGVGIYHSWIHYDQRPSGRARW